MRQAGHKPGRRTRAGNDFPEAEDTRVEQRRTDAPPDPQQRQRGSEPGKGTVMQSKAKASLSMEWHGKASQGDAQQRH